MHRTLFLEAHVERKLRHSIGAPFRGQLLVLAAWATAGRVHRVPVECDWGCLLCFVYMASPRLERVPGAIDANLLSSPTASQPASQSVFGPPKPCPRCHTSAETVLGLINLWVIHYYPRCPSLSLHTMKSALAFIALAAVSTATVADFKAIWGLECGVSPRLCTGLPR